MCDCTHGCDSRALPQGQDVKTSRRRVSIRRGVCDPRRSGFQLSMIRGEQPGSRSGVRPPTGCGAAGKNSPPNLPQVNANKVETVPAASPGQGCGRFEIDGCRATVGRRDPTLRGPGKRRPGKRGPGKTTSSRVLIFFSRGDFHDGETTQSQRHRMVPKVMRAGDGGRIGPLPS